MAGDLASRNPQAGLPTVVTLVLGPQTTLKAGMPVSALLAQNLVELSRSTLLP